MFKSVNHPVHAIFFSAITVCFVISANCWALPKPRLRISDYFGSPGGINYLDPDDLGNHCYRRCRGEKKGIVYTQKAGFVDIGHVREAADRTRYAVYTLGDQISDSKKRFKLKIIEPSVYYISIQYPDNWEQLDVDEREEIAREVSLRYGQYLAHQSLIWHEIITWFGYASSGIFSEQISSFSWEDPYSDVIGTSLAVEAIRRTAGDYDNQITQLLAEKLKYLKAEPASVAKEATQKIKGNWYTGDLYFFVEMKKRGFDVGFDDGQVTPWLVPGMFPDVVPQPCPAPMPNSVSEYGFEITVQLDPKASEKSAIYQTVGLNRSKDRLDIDVHFPMLLEAIREEARSKNGVDVDKPTL